MRAFGDGLSPRPKLKRPSPTARIGPQWQSWHGFLTKMSRRAGGQSPRPRPSVYVLGARDGRSLFPIEPILFFGKSHPGFGHPPITLGERFVDCAFREVPTVFGILFERIGLFHAVDHRWSIYFGGRNSLLSQPTTSGRSSGSTSSHSRHRYVRRPLLPSGRTNFIWDWQRGQIGIAD